jgi:adenylosuccinate synthase
LDGKVTAELPLYLENPNWRLKFKTFKGWEETKANTFKTLPGLLLDYISYIEGEVHAPIEIVSLGPNRVETVLKEAFI